LIRKTGKQPQAIECSQPKNYRSNHDDYRLLPQHARSQTAETTVFEPHCSNKDIDPMSSSVWEWQFHRVEGRPDTEIVQHKAEGEGVSSELSEMAPQNHKRKRGAQNA